MRLATYYFLVLDIENSVKYDDDGTPIGTWLTYGYCKLYSIEDKIVSTCYFREWVELYNYLHQISVRFYRYKILCYIHNLSYEFDFLIKNISMPEKILSNSSRNIISCTLKDFKSIEFRCTYQLSGYSLSKLGELMGFDKLHSDYRYILPKDEITEEEKDYCSRDCDIVAKYVITMLLKEYKNQTLIPLTKTGRVRKRFKELYSQYEDYTCKWDLMPDEDCVTAMEDAFAGGLVISNPMFTGLKLYKVKSKDETSAYPYTMLKEQFPYTIRKVRTFTNDMLNQKFWIAKIKFNSIVSKFNWNWLSISKMNEFDLENSHFFNGKLISANYIVRTITNIDFEMIKETYNFDSFEVLEFYSLEDYDYLPKCYIELITEYAEKKGRLKEELKSIGKIHGENSDIYLETNRDYMLAKNDFNSIYGMCVEKLMHSEYIIDENYLWQEVKKPYKQTTKHMKRNFLFGIYVTAYARRNLLRAIIKNCPDTLVYADTDSIKYFEIKEFVDTNERLTGVFAENKYLKDLGVFDDEGEYEEFLTYGAKKYAFKIDGYFDMRVAGVPRFKEDHPDRIKSLDDFYLGKIFKDCKLGKKYINTDYRFELDEYYNIVNIESMDEINRFYAENNIFSCGGVALFPVSYLLNMTKADLFQIKFYQRGLLKWAEKLKLPISTHLKNLNS